MAKDSVAVDRLVLPPLSRGGKFVAYKRGARPLIVRTDSKDDKIRVVQGHPSMADNKDFAAWDRAGMSEVKVEVEPDYDGLAWRLTASGGE